jgi:hypothetical protein
MSVAWFTIVAIAGLVLFLSVRLGDRAQNDAVDKLSEYSSPLGR